MTPEERFEKHFNNYRDGMFLASLEHYISTGKLSGSMLLQVRELTKEIEDDFKSALRKEIEKEIKTNAAYEDKYDCGRESGLKFALGLLETITPPKV